jgi:hypothetical protein
MEEGFRCEVQLHSIPLGDRSQANIHELLNAP